jgi:hypothetical protein
LPNCRIGKPKEWKNQVTKFHPFSFDKDTRITNTSFLNLEEHHKLIQEEDEAEVAP